MPSSPPGNSLRKPGLESLFERERKNTLLCLYLCVYVCVCFWNLCITACERLFLFWGVFYFFFAECVSVLEIKFVWEIE